MNQVNKLFNTEELKKVFYEDVKNELKKFCETEANTDVYAIVFDCDESVGQVSLRYASLEKYNEELKEFAKHAYMFEPYGKLGLKGYKYDEGNFKWINLKPCNYFKKFTDTYYYVMTKVYYGEDKEPDIEITREVEDGYKRFFQEVIIDCIEKLKNNIDELNKTNDFIIYLTYHDINHEERERLIKKTVDEELFEKLLKDSYTK